MLKKNIHTFLSFIVIILFYNIVSAQEKPSLPKSNIYEPYQVQIKGEYEGGRKQLLKILSSNLEYPVKAINNHVQGKVIVKFVIEKNGTITNFEILKDIGYGCADEIIRVLKKTQARWNSAILNKKHVRSYYTLRVNFKIPSNQSKPYIQDAHN
ncbi:energy transducer TonB [Apibacter sp. B3706]|uniref:energy transducer TonB n=1 Tax=Apibacter sp. B3706 TaxID=2656760 RepID=UPI00140DFACC|nr:energy transducer TonB [Apibacter sp. B3706]QII70504.1 energy transducer TonB [Apibacter sp. B3706]